MGGDGWLSTREMAEHLKLSMEAARDRLEALYSEQKIDFGRDGNIGVWHAVMARKPLPQTISMPVSRKERARRRALQVG